jgi:hypothetical protein
VGWRVVVVDGFRPLVVFVIIVDRRWFERNHWNVWRRSIVQYDNRKVLDKMSKPGIIAVSIDYVSIWLW